MFRIHCNTHDTDLRFPEFWTSYIHLGFSVYGEIDLDFEGDSVADYQHFDSDGKEIENVKNCELVLREAS